MTLDANTTLPQTAPSASLQPVAPSFARNMDLKSVTYMLRRRAKLIGRIAATTMIFALITAMLMTPMYKAETLVMLEPRHTDIVNIEAVLSPLTVSAEALRSEMATKTELQSEIRTLRADVASDLLTTRKELSEQIVGLRRAVMDYHTSVIGHGALISDLDARLRRVEQHLNLPPMIAS